MSDLAQVLARLSAVIESRKGGDPSASYTARLLAEPERAAKKLGEEAVDEWRDERRQRAFWTTWSERRRWWEDRARGAAHDTAGHPATESSVESRARRATRRGV